MILKCPRKLPRLEGHLITNQPKNPYNHFVMLYPKVKSPKSVPIVTETIGTLLGDLTIA